jgi:hypothetical protein
MATLMPDEAEWKMLARLFADGTAGFRHHLGLARRDPREFYAPAGQATSIAVEKRAILASPEADRHLFESAEGLAAAREFVPLTGCQLPEMEARALNRAATLALEPDFILLAPPDWRLIWASVCFPTRWSLEGKGLQPIADIHAVVPGLNAELGHKIDVFFTRLKPEEGWSRANWGLSTSPDRNLHPRRPYTPLAGHTPLESVHLRMESQHLLKLPESGAVGFGIRISSFPLAAVADHPAILAGLKEQLRTMPAEVAAYKAIPERFWQRL